MIKYAVFDNEPDWLAFRAEYFTASESSKLITSAKDKNEVLSVGAKTYIRKCAAAVLAPNDPPYYNSSMERGKNTEPVAVLSLAKHLGRSVDDDDFIYTSQNGFVFFYDDEYNLGGTPDVIIKGINKSVEIKCPNSDTHLEYLMISTAEEVKSKMPDYYGQMQTNMYLTGTKECIFMSFDNRFYNENLHEHYIIIPKDPEYIERLLLKAKHAKEYKEQILNIINKNAKVEPRKTKATRARKSSVRSQ
ncbi:YqaJ viral recombinase family protein [Chryseobacterium indologenes]|uniref:YqaJ viral recombinase family protein n=1 Tax=Chryseobacterium indologenes TaxID=253 RepID=UPI0007879E4E|nr:YqaJ viral recombinase family protein [Chryseobacterium indologenes]